MPCGFDISSSTQLAVEFDQAEKPLSPRDRPKYFHEVFYWDEMQAETGLLAFGQGEPARLPKSIFVVTVCLLPFRNRTPMGPKAQFTLSAMTDVNVVRDHVEVFRGWVANQGGVWTVRPPVNVYGPQGEERIAFVVLKHDQVYGVFTSPMHALIKMGDPNLTSAFQAYMRDRSSLGKS